MRKIPELKIIPYGGERKLSSQAVWGRRLALISLVLVSMCIVLFRIGLFNFDTVAFGMMIAVVVGLTALFLSVWAIPNIRKQQIDGMKPALTGSIVAFVVVAFLLPIIYNYISLPNLSEVSTDLRNPPNFTSLDEKNSKVDDRLITETQIDRQRQLQAYPDIRSMLLKYNGRDAYNIVRLAAENMDWKIVSAQPPQSDGSPGRIRAVDQSYILGLKNQIIVRIVDNGNQSMVDVRSATQSVSHDLGENAKQIRRLFAAVQTSEYEFPVEPQISNQSLNEGSSEKTSITEKDSDVNVKTGPINEESGQKSVEKERKISAIETKPSSNLTSDTEGGASNRTNAGSATANIERPVDPEIFGDRVLQPNEQLPAIDPLQRQELYGNDMIGSKTEDSDLTQKPEIESLNGFVPENEIDEFGTVTEEAVIYKKPKKKVVKSGASTSRDLMRLALPESTE